MVTRALDQQKTLSRSHETRLSRWDPSSLFTGTGAACRDPPTTSQRAVYGSLAATPQRMEAKHDGDLGGDVLGIDHRTGMPEDSATLVSAGHGRRLRVCREIGGMVSLGLARWWFGLR